MVHSYFFFDCHYPFLVGLNIMFNNLGFCNYMFFLPTAKLILTSSTSSLVIPGI